MSARVHLARSGPQVAALTIAALLSAAPAWAQSLGAVAREAEARRKTGTPATKVYTSDDVRPAAPSAAAPVPATPDATDPGAAPPDGTKESPAGDGDEVEVTPKGESYWRDRIEAEREALTRAEAFAAALQSQINGLYAEFSACQAPPQCNEISQKRQQSLAELERVKKEIAEHTKKIADIQTEGRKAGVPAGWLR